MCIFPLNTPLIYAKFYTIQGHHFKKIYRKRSKHLSVNDKAPKNKDFDFKRIFAVTDWTVRNKIKYDI